jgi:hypothetical protein
MTKMKLATTDNVRVKAYDTEGNFVVSFYNGNYRNIKEIFAEVKRKVPMHYDKKMIVVNITKEQDDATNEYRIPINKY